MRALDPGEMRRFVATARRAVLATVDPAGVPRLVPICFVVEGASPDDARADDGGGDGSARIVLYSPIDEKPKRSDDPLALARVRDLQGRPDAAVLVDRWSEDWSTLAWVRLACRGSLMDPANASEEHANAVRDLRAKYPQYRDQRLESRPLIRLDCSVASWWEAAEEGA